MADNYLRTTPIHKRSQKTVQAVLDTAEQLFLDAGYDKVTTRAISKRSGLSVGSLYHFFPNKKAILDGLAARHFAAQQQMHIDMSALSPNDDLEAFLRTMVDKIANHFLLHAPFERIIYAHSSSPEIIQYAQKFHEQTLERTVRNMMAVFPDLPEAQLQIQAEISTTITRDLLGVAQRHSARDQKQIKEKLIAALVAAWKPLLDP